MTSERPEHDGRSPLVIASSVRRRIIDDLVALGPGEPGESRHGLSAADIGERLGLHVTTARFHLDRLIESGVVEGFREARGTVGRPRKLYAVRFDALPTGRTDVPYRQLSDILSELWEQTRRGTEPDAARAGYDWALLHDLGVGPSPRAATVGAWLVKVEILAGVVERWGHRCSITLHDGGDTIDLGLGDCPFAPIAHLDPGLVRELHRGILTGLLARLGEPDVDVSVAEIDDDDLCLATLRTRTPLTLRVGVRQA